MHADPAAKHTSWRAVPSPSLGESDTQSCDLQVSVPSMVVDAIESLNAENPDHVRALFQLRVSELQMTLAAEDNLHDVRCAASSRLSM